MEKEHAVAAVLEQVSSDDLAAEENVIAFFLLFVSSETTSNLIHLNLCKLTQMRHGLIEL